MTLEGAGSGSAQTAGTRLIFDADSDGVIFESYSSSIDGGHSEGAALRNINVFASSKKAKGHGIVMRGYGNLENVTVFAFKGDGVHIFGSFGGSGGEDFPAWQAEHEYQLGDSITGPGGEWYICRKAGRSARTGTGPTGTPAQQVPISDGDSLLGVVWQHVSGAIADLFRLYNVAVESCDGDGFHVSGADANVGTGIGCSARLNGGWGIHDNSFLGNTWIGCHTAANVAGPYKCIGANTRSVFLGCYSESGQPPSLIKSPSQVYGGLHDAGILGTALCFVNSDLYGWLIMGGNNSGPYNGTATTNDTTSIVLNAQSGVLAPGDLLTIREASGAETSGRIDTISGLTLTMDTVFRAGIDQPLWRPNKMRLVLGDLGSDAIQRFHYDKDGGSLDLKYLPPGTLTTDGGSQIFYWQLANSGVFWGWGHTNDSAMSANQDNPARQILSGNLFTGAQRGLINEGARIIHANDPTARTETGFQSGDLVFRRDSANPSLECNIGWQCIKDGNNGTYTEGLTAITKGTPKVVLSAATGTLNVGDTISIANGTPVKIRDISVDRVTLTVDTNLIDGIGQDIRYVAPVFRPFGQLYGGHGDSTGSSGDATLNTWKGRSSFAIGQATCAVTNSKVTAASIVTAVLQTDDTTLTAIRVVECFGGYFIVRANAPCTVATNFGWVLET